MQATFKIRDFSRKTRGARKTRGKIRYASNRLKAPADDGARATARYKPQWETVKMQELPSSSRFQMSSSLAPRRITSFCVVPMETPKRPRWALIQVLLKNKNMGMHNPAATIYWLAPVMGLTLAIISFVLDDWSALFSIHFFVGSKALQTVFFLTMSGIVTFCRTDVYRFRGRVRL
ncbi:hypothetical protein DFH09DRAFT_1414504 [Mycena vulgaris]|nr:hypothetical protein DFH09DRAFT_1414504 [Mycena vulgaris]